MTMPTFSWDIMENFNESVFTETEGFTDIMYTDYPIIKPNTSGNNINMKLAYFIVTILGMLDNALVIFVISLSKGLRERVTNKYIMNQSIIDFLACVILLITSKIPDPVYDTSWVSTFICKVSLSINCFSCLSVCVSSCLTGVCIFIIGLRTGYYNVSCLRICLL